jgi:ParB family chromosome partitioning protein
MQKLEQNKFEMALQRGARKEQVQRTKNGEDAAARVEIRAIPLGKIEIRDNLRRNAGEIAELAANIRKYGIQQPITVYPAAKKKGCYVVKFGHRRFLALRELAKKEPKRYNYVDCVVADGENILVSQLIENVQRSDLTQAELCDALAAMREQGMTHKAIATVLGKSESYVNSLFTAVNEIALDDELRKILSNSTCAGTSTDTQKLSLDEIARTKSVKDRAARLALLKERQEGKITRSELYARAKELSGKKASAETQAGGKADAPESLDPKPLQMWACPASQEIRIKLSGKNRERFEHLTGIVAAYLDRHRAYYLAEGGMRTV